jgi:hypothetical protein
VLWNHTGGCLPLVQLAELVELEELVGETFLVTTLNSLGQVHEIGNRVLIICFQDLVETNRALESYRELDPSFGSTRPGSGPRAVGAPLSNQRKDQVPGMIPKHG